MQVVPLKKPSHRHPEEILAFKHLAIQLAAQLPQDPDEAIEVLRLTESLVRSFLGQCEAS